MKCPKCSRSQKYKSGMTCRNCQYRFLIDPKRDGYTDNRFLMIINKLKQQGEGYFTFNQFFAMLHRKNKATPPGCVAGIVAVFGTIGVIAVTDIPVVGLVVGLALAGLVFWLLKNKKTTAPNLTKVQQPWERWISSSVFPTQGLLTKPSLSAPAGLSAEGDLYDYGVEGILIVDRPILVDLLVLNKIHSEFRLLVIASDTYPDFLLAKANELLTERSDLPVYLLHDAKTIASRMTDRLNLSGHKVYDLGLSRKNYEKHPRLSPYQHLPSQPVDVLSLNELRILLRQGIRSVTEDDYDTDDGWIFFPSDGDTYEETASGGLYGMDTIFDDAMDNADADGSDFG